MDDDPFFRPKVPVVESSFSDTGTSTTTSSLCHPAVTHTVTEKLTDTISEFFTETETVAPSTITKLVKEVQTIVLTSTVTVQPTKLTMTSGSPPIDDEVLPVTWIQRIEFGLDAISVERFHLLIGK